jgi:hypothetical protein
MPTDLAAFRVKLLAEKQAVLDELAVVDIPDEQARIATAEAVMQTASRAFEKAQRRWSLVNDKQQRLVELDAQIAVVTP